MGHESLTCKKCGKPATVLTKDLCKACHDQYKEVVALAPPDPTYKPYDYDVSLDYIRSPILTLELPPLSSLNEDEPPNLTIKGFLPPHQVCAYDPSLKTCPYNYECDGCPTKLQWNAIHGCYCSKEREWITPATCLTCSEYNKLRRHCEYTGVMPLPS